MALQWPDVLDWQEWTERFDRMQDRCLAGRGERFEVIVRTVRAVQPHPRTILELGCGTGSLSLRLLEAFPQSRLIGLDLDESMLALAERRLARFGGRVHLLRVDLREQSWLASMDESFDVVVSSTALHWLSPARLAALYGLLPGLMTAGGIFLNADHAGSVNAAVQDAWRERDRTADNEQDAESWDDFWQAYTAALGVDATQAGAGLVSPWQGVEEGMPLAWHLERLREAGFGYVDCFWRCDGDAVFGGVLGDE